jgi:hypothetical protein
VISTTGPVASIDGLENTSELLEGVGFANPGNFILNPGCESLVILVSKGVLIPLELSGEAIKLNIILRDPVVVFHGEHIDVILSVTRQISWTEVVSEFLRELIPAFEPYRRWVFFAQDCWFGPFERRAFEIGNSVIDLCFIGIEGLGVVTEVELALNEPSPEFTGVSSLKRIWFAELGLLALDAAECVGHAMDGMCQVWLLGIVLVIFFLIRIRVSRIWRSIIIAVLIRIRWILVVRWVRVVYIRLRVTWIQRSRFR